MNKDLNPDKEFMSEVQDAMFEALKEGQEIRGLDEHSDMLSDLFKDYGDE